MRCARCHQHPFDRWTQHDFASFATIFAHTEFGSSTELRAAMNGRLERRREARRSGAADADLPEIPRLQEVFTSARPRPLFDAAAANAPAPAAPGGEALDAAGDARVALFEWLVRADNPYFAHSFVNRIWAKYFGRGLVEPVDAFSATNPPTHPRLLDLLAGEFVRSGYDVAHIERHILSSATYQRSCLVSGNNASDHHNLARAPIRPLPAEVVLDALNAALEGSDDFGPDVPAGSHAVELAPNRFADPSISNLLRMLGRGDRKSLCECDRAASPTLRQPIFLMADPRVLDKIRGGRLSRLLAANRDDTEIVEELYLATLSRPPDDDERRFALHHVSQSADRRAGLTDVVWALVNTREFIANH
jgi:hypothetical protein